MEQAAVEAAMGVAENVEESSNNNIGREWRDAQFLVDQTWGKAIEHSQSTVSTDTLSLEDDLTLPSPSSRPSTPEVERFGRGFEPCKSLIDDMERHMEATTDRISHAHLWSSRDWIWHTT